MLLAKHTHTGNKLCCFILCRKQRLQVKMTYDTKTKATYSVKHIHTSSVMLEDINFHPTNNLEPQT